MHPTDSSFAHLVQNAVPDSGSDLFRGESQEGAREGIPSIVLKFLALMPWSLCQKIARKSAGTVYIFDWIEQRNLHVSGPLAERLGYRKEELQKKGLFALATLLHPDDLPRVSECFSRYPTLQPGAILEVRYRMRRVDGRFGWFRSRETLYRPATKKPSFQLLGIVEEMAGEGVTEPTKTGKDAPKPVVDTGRVGYWIEIVAGEPEKRHYLGPFESLAATERPSRRDIESLREVCEGKLSVAIKYGRPVPSGRRSWLFQESSDRAVRGEDET